MNAKDLPTMPSFSTLARLNGEAPQISIDVSRSKVSAPTTPPAPRSLLNTGNTRVETVALPPPDRGPNATPTAKPQDTTRLLRNGAPVTNYRGPSSTSEPAPGFTSREFPTGADS